MARGFSGYFERLEIKRICVFAPDWEAKGAQFTHARPLHNQISPSGRVERNDAAPMGGAARPSRAHAPNGRAKPLRPPPLGGVPGLDGLLGGASSGLVGSAPRDALGTAGASESELV